LNNSTSIIGEFVKLKPIEKSVQRQKEFEQQKLSAAGMKNLGTHSKKDFWLLILLLQFLTNVFELRWIAKASGPKSQKTLPEDISEYEVPQADY